ncbi:hypothetical protein P7C70_g4425, partial [Phenoliferia sp. Uapishka_3]
MSESDEKRSSSGAASEVGGVDEKVANDFAKEKGALNLNDVLPVLEHLSLDEARDIIRQTIEGRESDPNFDAVSRIEDIIAAHMDLRERLRSQELLRRARKALEESALSQEAAHLLVEELKLEAALFDDSPYLQANSTDDPDLPVNTFRAWFLGMIYVTSPAILQPDADWASSFHQEAPVCTNKSSTGRANPGYQILMTLATQMLGFGVAGLARRFLVYPPAMIWPSNLATIALNRSFHEEENKPANGWRISRLRFFLYVFIAYSLYFVLPDAIFGALSYFNWMTWISWIGYQPLADIRLERLYNHSEIWSGFKAIYKRHSPREAYNDVHNRLMRRYKEVPEWWFMIVLVISTRTAVTSRMKLKAHICQVFGIVSTEVYHLELPVWAIFFGVALALFLIIPIGIVTAVTNLEITTNVVGEVIGGYVLPGKPLAVMLFKLSAMVKLVLIRIYRCRSHYVGMLLAQDMKLGHYVKIPPRSLFWAQTVASIWASFVGVGVADWQIGNIKNLCTAGQVRITSTSGACDKIEAHPLSHRPTSSPVKAAVRTVSPDQPEKPPADAPDSQTKYSSIVAYNGERLAQREMMFPTSDAMGTVALFVSLIFFTPFLKSKADPPPLPFPVPIPAIGYFGPAPVGA